MKKLENVMLLYTTYILIDSIKKVVNFCQAPSRLSISFTKLEEGKYIGKVDRKLTQVHPLLNYHLTQMLNLWIEDISNEALLGKIDLEDVRITIEKTDDGVHIFNWLETSNEDKILQVT